MIFGWLLFSAMFWAAEHREIIVGAYFILALWMLFFDRVGPKGEETLLGWRAGKTKPFIGSIFGRKIDD